MAISIRLILTAFSCFFASMALATPPAIIIVDMQQPFLEKAPMRIVKNLVHAQMELLDWAQKMGSKVLVFEFKNNGPTISPLKEKIESFGAENFALFDKNKMGGFDSVYRDRSQPGDVLRAWDVSEVIIAGVYGSACIYLTAQGAQAQKIKVSTSPEIVADFCSSSALIYPDAEWWNKADYSNLFEGFRDLRALMACPRFLEGGQ